MKLAGRAILTATILLFLSINLAAQEEENLDGLFDDPAGDTVVVDTDQDHLSQYVTSDSIKFSGLFNTAGGISAGWTDWPRMSDPADGFDVSAGLLATANLYFDARPDPDFRFYGYVTTTMNPLAGAYTWNEFTIGELFVDYTWLGSVFVRMGKHTIAWGQARLFESITDIMVDAVHGFSVRASIPTLLNGVSVIGLLDSATVSSYRNVTYAAKVDEIVFGTMVSLGARYQLDAGFKTLLSIKKVVWGIDLLGDVVVHYDDTIWYPRAIAGFFKEWPGAKLYGEYYYDGADHSGFDHKTALAFGFDDILGSPIDLGLQWIHAFIDTSGSITTGITWKPWKFITATFAVPISYGPDGSRHVTIENVGTLGKMIALVFGLEFEVSF